MNKLERALLSNDVGIVKESISNMEYEYYTSDDSEELKDYFEDFEFYVPNYDTLIKAMGIENNQDPKLTEIYTDELESKMNKIDIYDSKEFINLYFIRMEQYGLADEDATISRVIFTENPEGAMEACKKILDDRNIVLEFRKINKAKKKEEENEI